MRLTAFAAVCLALSTPVHAEVLELKEGDVYCISYDEKSNSCASVQTLKDLGDGEYLFLDLSGFNFGKTNLSMTSTMKARVEGEQLCMVPGELKISIQPKESKLAEGYQNLMQYTLDTMVEEGYCFEHKTCGDEYVAIGYLGGKARQDMSATFQIFEADDPRAKTVQPRFLGEAELSTMQKKVSDKCFPKDA